MSVQIVFQQMLIIFIMMLIGYGAYKKGILQEGTSRGISALVVNICNPAILIRSAFERDPSVTAEKIGMAALGAIAMYAVLIIASLILPKLLRTEKKWENHYALMSIFGNTGFIGIPLVSAVLGNQALIYVAVVNAFFNLIFYTYGLRLADTKGNRGIRWKDFLNAGNLSILVTILLFIFQPPLPVVVTSVIDYMADTTTFLATVVIGISLARTNLREMVTQWKMYFFIAARFLVVPIAVGLLLRPFITDDIVYGTLVLLTSVPAANLPLMRVEELGGDTKVLSCGIILSTVLSLITIPLVVAFV